MTKLISFLGDRAKERSTWLGLIAVLGAVGVSLTPDQVDAIAGAGVALAGAVLAFTADPKPPAAA